MASYDKTGPHFLFSSYPAWGHIRAFCNLSARIVKDNERAVVTILLAPNLLSIAKSEVAAEFGDQLVSESTLQRVRVLSSFHSESQNPLDLWQPHIDNYVATYQDLMQGKSIICASTGTVLNAAPAPSFVVMDTMAYDLMVLTRAISGSSVPIAAWLAGHVASLIRVYGPEHLGGHGDIGAKVDAEAVRKGVTSKEIGDSVYNYTDGSIVKIPGLPDMYDWEFFPQILPFEVNMSDMYRMIHSGIKEGDIVFSTSVHTFEEASIDAMKSWFADWGKDLYVVGPLLPTGYGYTAENHPGSLETRDFLRKSLAEHGENSVMLISFGTVFWPTVREYIEEVIEALIERKLPFIVTYASPFASISDELIHRIKMSGLGLISKWFPQQYILNHPATGWFISHCGQNSIMESLGSGTPVICWPFESDQPGAAAHLTENLKVAFELIEVRTGKNGMKPLKRNGRKAQGTREAVGIEIRQVLDDCRGTKGEELRKNAEEMKKKLANAWAEHGESKQEFQKFLIKYGLGQLNGPS